MALDDAASLLTVLTDHNLLRPAELAAARALAASFPAARNFARELVRTGLLTPFQVNQIFLGRARELTLGQYVLLERLGAGAMGQVYKARHSVLDRLAALKVLHTKAVPPAAAVERFQRECRAAALLSHTNIVQVYDAHLGADVQFLAMEYLQGKDLGRLLKERGSLPPAEACEYVRQAALGLQHAHERGLVHRDVKPSNLMATADGRTVKVLDLGLALLRNPAGDGPVNAGLTHEGAIMGTPDYLAPEQAAGDSHLADGRADVYSLGCTLYHLLSGEPPFPGRTLREKIDGHLRREPVSLETGRPGMPSGLSGVVRRMMAKELAARYQTPGEVAAALRPFCSAAAEPAEPSKPMSATVTYVPPRPTGRRLLLWSAAAVAAVVLLTCSGLALLAWAMFSPPRKAQPTPPDIALATDKDKGQRPDGGPDPGVKPPLKLPPPPKRVAVRDGLVWPPPECVALLGDDSGRHWNEVTALAFRPDGKLIATADQIAGAAYIHLWDADTLRERSAWTPAGLFVMDVAFSPNGRLLAAVCGDGVRLWDAGDDGLSREHKIKEPSIGPGSNVQHLRFAADGALVTWDAGGVVRKWDASKGDPTEVGDPTSAPPQVSPLTISADGRTLAYGMHDRGAPKPGVYVRTLFDKKANELSAEAPSTAAALALSADGKRLAARLGSGEMRIWDIEDGKLSERRRIDLDKFGLSSYLPAFQFTPDGRKVVCLSVVRGGPSTLWSFDATTGDATKAATFDGPAASMSMPGDGKALAVVGKDHRLRLWEDKGAGFVLRPSGPASVGVVQRLAFRRGGAELAVVSRLDDRPDQNATPSNLIIWDVTKARERATISSAGWFTDCAYTPDGSRLFAVGAAPGKGGPVPAFREGFLRIWQADGLKEEEPPELPKPLRGASLEMLTFDRDGKTLALLGGGDFTRLAGVCVSQPFRVRGKSFDVGQQVDSLALAPDGSRVAVLATNSAVGRGAPVVKFWDLQDVDNTVPTAAEGTPPLEGAQSQIARRLTYSPDGKTIAALVKMGPFPDDPRKVMLWDVATGRTRAAGDPKSDKLIHVECYAFSPDSRMLATAEADGRVTLWRADTMALQNEWQFPGPVNAVAFSAEGDFLAVGDGNGTVAVLSVPRPGAGP